MKTQVFDFSHDKNLRVFLIEPGELNMCLKDRDSLKDEKDFKLGYKYIAVVLVFGETKDKLRQSLADEYGDIMSHLLKFDTPRCPDMHPLLEYL